jgi:Ran GTPase-activating protein (RanGAP) involved in mRNA processing and transport
VRSISSANLKLSDSELGLILNEIRLFDKSSLQYLDLSGNHIDEFVVESLSALLQSKNTCLKYLEFGHRDISVDALNILAAALKNNRSLVSVDINVSFLVADHPIRNDKRVKLSRTYSPWI